MSIHYLCCTYFTSSTAGTINNRAISTPPQLRTHNVANSVLSSTSGNRTSLSTYIHTRRLAAVATKQRVSTIGSSCWLSASLSSSLLTTSTTRRAKVRTRCETCRAYSVLLRACSKVMGARIGSPTRSSHLVGHFLYQERNSRSPGCTRASTTRPTGPCATQCTYVSLSRRSCTCTERGL